MKDIGCTDCAAAIDKLHEYVDRELSEADLAEVKRHLDDCPPCQRHFHFEEHLKLLVHQNACPERAPAHLLSRILGNLRQA